MLAWGGRMQGLGQPERAQEVFVEAHRTTPSTAATTTIASSSSSSSASAAAHLHAAIAAHLEGGAALRRAEARYREALALDEGAVLAAAGLASLLHEEYFNTTEAEVSPPLAAAPALRASLRSHRPLCRGR